jgi:hypothetical protein
MVTTWKRTRMIKNNYSKERKSVVIAHERWRELFARLLRNDQSGFLPIFSEKMY